MCGGVREIKRVQSLRAQRYFLLAAAPVSLRERVYFPRLAALVSLRQVAQIRQSLLA
jgi:hypothetical protein